MTQFTKGEWVDVGGVQARVVENRGDRLVCWFPDDPQGCRFVFKKRVKRRRKGEGQMVYHGRSDLFAVRPCPTVPSAELIWTDGGGDSWLFNVREAVSLARRLIWAALVARYRTARFGE